MSAEIPHTPDEDNSRRTRVTSLIQDLMVTFPSEFYDTTTEAIKELVEITLNRPEADIVALEKMLKATNKDLLAHVNNQPGDTIH